MMKGCGCDIDCGGVAHMYMRFIHSAMQTYRALGNRVNSTALCPWSVSAFMRHMSSNTAINCDGSRPPSPSPVLQACTGQWS